MKRIDLTLGLGLFLAITAVAPLEGHAKQPEGAAAAPLYQPPLRGAPASRVGGGTRGPESQGVELAVLAPDHTGLTTHSSPSLYWYISQPGNAQVEVTVIEEQGTATLLETSFPAPDAAGIHKLSLAEHGIALRPGVEYRWNVALVPDPKQRSNDIVASGTIRYQAPSPGLLKQLAQGGTDAAPGIYAQSGIWYDAIDTMSALVARHPSDIKLRQQRAGLLTQVGLKQAAEHEQAAAR